MSNVTISVMAEPSEVQPDLIHVHAKVKFANQPVQLARLDIQSQFPISRTSTQADRPDTEEVEGEDPKQSVEAECSDISLEGMLDRAECIALWHLLEQTPVVNHIPHDKITLEVSSGALRRMTQRDHLKVFDHGAVHNTHLAKYTRFLCTKYFGVKISTLRKDKFWKNIDRNALVYHAQIPWTQPTVHHVGKWGYLYVSVHSMNRAVLRTQLPQPQPEQALLDQPNSLWTNTYQYLDVVWSRVESLILPRDVLNQLTNKEGVRASANLRFFLDPETKHVYVTSKLGASYTLITVLPSSRYSGKLGRAIAEKQYTAAHMTSVLQNQINEQALYHAKRNTYNTPIPYAIQSS